MCKNFYNKCSFNKFNIDDLENGVSIYCKKDIFYSNNNYLSENLDINDYELDSFVDFSENIDYNDCVANCSTCYYNCNGFCSAKGYDVSHSEDYPADCWQYRNSITLKAVSDFQDDYDEVYDDFN